MPLVFVTAIAVAAQATTAAPLVTGQVLDPGNLPVAGAIVRVECGPLAASTESDAAGRFVVRAPAGGLDCFVEVRRDGFVTWISPVRGDRPVSARLTLAIHRESLTVRGDEPAASRPASGSSNGERLREMTNSPEQMIAMARAMAGAVQADQRVYVDGSPRRVLPTADRFERVTVNPDPYSAAFGDLDGARIEVETSPLPRTWRYTISASPGSLSAGHPLGAGHQWQTRSVVGGASGPVPRTALAWSAGVTRTRRSQESPVLSTSSPDAPSVTAESREELDGVYAGGSYQRGPTRVLADINVQDTRAFASGAGTLVLPEAATDVGSRVVEVNASIRRDTAAATFTSSGSVQFTRRLSRARSEDQGFATTGSFVRGGAALAAEEIRTSYLWWSGRVSGVAGDRAWRAGGIVNSSTADYAWTPNPLGVVNLAPDGSRPIFTQLELGSGASRLGEHRIAAYGELQVIRTTRLDITSGLRFDAARGADLAASPRISGAVKISKTTLSFGAGQFVEEFNAAALFPLYARSDGGTIYAATDDAGTMMGSARVSIAPRRQWLASIGAARPWRSFDLAAEYRWSRIRNAPSITREVAGAVWNEVFGSDARMRQQEARIQLRVGRGDRTLAPYYTWRRAMDTADGWWGAPVSAALPAAWAPVAGLATQEGGFVLSFKGPAATSASIVGALSSGRAMDVFFAPVSLREVLGAPIRPAGRNSAVGPATASVQLFASRKITIDRLHVRGRVGAHVTNLFGRRNLLAPVNVLDSPLYGRATDASAARSLSVWFALGQ